MTYSIDFRKSAMNHLHKGGNVTKTSQLFSVSRLTLYNWKKIEEETGKLKPKPIKCFFKKIDPAVLEQRVSNNPNVTRKEPAFNQLV